MQAKTKTLKAARGKSVDNAYLHADIARQITITILTRTLRSSRGYRSDMRSDNKTQKRRRSAGVIAVFRVEKAKFGPGISLSNSIGTRCRTSVSLITTKISGMNGKARKSATSTPESFRYDLGSKLGLNAQYRHEDILAKPETATDTTSTSGSYYGGYGYGRNRDEKTDSGTITLNISPTNIFSLSPTYDISRTLEKRENRNYRNVGIQPETPDPEEEETEPDFSIAEREHRLSLTPRLNRDLLGVRPTVTSRMSFRENWFSEQKNASLNGNVSLGMNLRIQKWFGWLLGNGNGKQEEKMDGVSNLPRSQPSTPETSTLPTESGETELAPTTDDYNEQLRENGIDETQIQELEENRGDWIERDKTAVSNQKKDSGLSGNISAESQQPMVSNSQQQDGILNRVLKSFTVSTNANFTATESYQATCLGSIAYRDLFAR